MKDDRIAVPPCFLRHAGDSHPITQGLRDPLARFADPLPDTFLGQTAAISHQTMALCKSLNKYFFRSTI